MNISELALEGVAKVAAEELLAQCPDVEFTSGRRTIEQQARAMATNVVLNRAWIAQTYRPSKGRDMCSLWIYKHPESRSVAGISLGLATVLATLPFDELGKLSKHLSGKAFDVRPMPGASGALVHAALTKLAAKYDGLFLDREGGLARWHIQF